LASVEALLRKHEAFEKTLDAQISKIDDLERFALELLTNGHFDADYIQTRVQAVSRRRDKLREASAVRKKRLLESRELQAFLRSLYEVRFGCIFWYGPFQCRSVHSKQRTVQKH
jgi:hypothetical protein